MQNFSPAADRNKEPIFMALNPFLPENASVLEIASGTGQHAVHIAAERPDIRWQPSDREEEALYSIEAWRAGSRIENVLPALELDVMHWERCAAVKGQSFDAIVSINMIHISAWSSYLALLALAKAQLKAKATLFLYGPFLVSERETAPSNRAFDASLKERNPSWGLRDLDKVTAEAFAMGFRRTHVVDMPANNLSVVYQKI